jgi:Ni/Co efflux regulator RcnB
VRELESHVLVVLGERAVVAGQLAERQRDRLRDRETDRQTEKKRERERERERRKDRERTGTRGCGSLRASCLLYSVRERLWLASWLP